MLLSADPAWSCGRLLLPAQVQVRINNAQAHTLSRGSNLHTRFDVLLRAFGEDCRIALGALHGTSDSVDFSVSLREQLHGVALGASNAAGSTQIRGNIPAGGTLRIPLYAVLLLESNRLPLAGRHSFQIPLVLFDDQSDGTGILDEEILQVETQMPAVVSLQVDGGSSASLSLGDLRHGGQVSLPLEIVANLPVVLSVNSSHNGHLVHQRDDSLRIPYQAWLEGRALTLGQGGTVVNYTSNSHTTITETLSFQVAEQNRAVAGEYRDVLQISIAAL